MISISAVVKDLGTTLSGVQSAIALEALVSAAAILISSKVGDLIGRKRASIANNLDEDAEVVSNTKLEEDIAHKPKAVQAEVLDINKDATNLSLQVALIIPILASLIGLFNCFRMMRLPDVARSASVEGATLG